MNIKSKLSLVSYMFLLLTISSTAFAQDVNPIEGRWDMVISQDGKELPSWLEVKHSGISTLVGRFVYASGSARPISEVKFTDGKFSFTIPPQWEEGNNLQFKGEMVGDGLKGTLLFADGKTYNWIASRAPKLEYTRNPVWGKPIALFNGKDMNSWHAMGENQWIVEAGVLKSPKSGSNLASNDKYKDFKLHIEFRYPEESNSGVYLRGRYEVQVADNKGMEPSNVLFGGIYGFLTPNEMVAKAAGEWQSYDITLIGRRVSIIANGISIINDQIIPGITGGALDSKEGEPGPFLIQGDHGPVEYRNIVVTPVLN